MCHAEVSESTSGRKLGIAASLLSGIFYWASAGSASIISSGSHWFHGWSGINGVDHRVGWPWQLAGWPASRHTSAAIIDHIHARKLRASPTDRRLLSTHYSVSHSHRSGSGATSHSGLKPVLPLWLAASATMPVLEWLIPLSSHPIWQTGSTNA